MKKRIDSLKFGEKFTDSQGRVLTRGREHGAHRGCFFGVDAQGFQYLYAGCAEVTVA